MMVRSRGVGTARGLRMSLVGRSVVPSRRLPLSMVAGRSPAGNRAGLMMVLLVAWAACGCRGPENRYGARTGPGSEGSTIGSDLRRAAPGTTIGPPSIGVDLVGYTSDRPGAVRHAAADDAPAAP